MISAKLLGGLGNQMFVIASTYALALRNNTEAKFNFDECFTPLQGFTSNKYKDNIFKNVKTYQGNYPFKNYYKEPKHSYSPIPYSEDLLIHDSYLQSELYFKDYKKEIIDLFHFDEKDINMVNSHIDFLTSSEISITTVHVRRGDYLKFPNVHPTMSVAYYKEAMNRIGHDNVFIFVSDDMNWVKENFKGENIFYSPFNDEIMDLTLFTQADNNIICNSSFSWWGAYLNQYEDKTIIAPKHWFHKDANIDDSTLIPNDKNWIRL